ncbi:hypothetical protein [Novosphingobium sp.]|uniref:hypothetical protein n=1 Tax=Novosphingobium sp. TaxID=1874826 RepID=UPI0031D446C9
MMSAIRKITAKAVLCFSLLALTSQASAQSQPTTIALAPYLGVVWSFEAELAGKRRTFLFDTGGGISVITAATAAEIGCAPWGQITGFRMRGDRVDMARCNDVSLRSNGVTLTTSTAGVFDFARLLPKDAPPLAGSVALDSFAGKILTIDLAHRQLVLETPASLKRRIAGAKEIRLRLAGEVSGHAVTPFVAIGTPRGQVWMEVDTGSDSSVIVGSHNAELFSMKADSKEPQRFRGELTGGVRLVVDDAHAMPLVLDGNIGVSILKTWVLTMDMDQGRAWISPVDPH